MHKNVDQFEEQINQLKNKLIVFAEGTGMNSPETIACSQELDQLILLVIKSQEFKYHTTVN